MALIDREFPTFARGEIREIILTQLRASFRQLGADETTIRRATMPKSRDWVEADAIDLIGQGIQRRGDFLAQQVNPARAASPFLYNFHGVRTGLTPLLARGGAGFVFAQGELGTTWIGSTTVPDPLATQAVDTAGNRYQVFTTSTITVAGVGVSIPVVAIDTGRQTNILVGEELEWSNRPIGSEPKSEVTGENFRGGIGKETDAEFIERMLDIFRSRPKAGNPSHQRYWARTSSNSIAEAFVYPCAFNVGSALISIVQKRAGAIGPYGRLPTFATLALATGYLVPPTAPEQPGDPHIVVSGWNGEPSNLVMRLGMRFSSEGGWLDASPWPTYAGAPSTITLGASQTSFTMTAPAGLPAGVTAPKLMVWNDATSRFELLNVSSVAPSGLNYLVTLSGAHVGKTLAVGDYISPASGRHLAIATATEKYFDSLGTGEVVDVASSPLAGVAFRRVEPEIRYNYFAGSRVLEYLREEVGASLIREELATISPSSPSLPSSMSLGPSMLVLGKVGVYALT